MKILKTLLRVLIFFIFSLAIISCNKKENIINTNDLIGVWSGLLFQTASKFDSLKISPLKQPTEAILYLKSGKKERIPLSREGNNISFKTQGFRFDGKLSKAENKLNGIITHDLWVQSLDFTIQSSSFISHIPKAEIIDTDYFVYLAFFKDSEGELQAKIHSNKENRKLHFIIEKVSVEGNRVNFKISNNRFGISASYNSKEKEIELAYSNLGGKREIKLKKASKNQLEGFYPVTPDKKYFYKTPSKENESIETASIKEVGIKSSLLNIIDTIKRGEYNHIHSILITKNNKLVFEEYFHGYHRNYLHDIRSAFKSLAALQVAHAFQSGYLISIHEPILKYYPDYKIKDINKNKISIHHTLTMSTGLQLEDEDVMQWKNNDWVKYKLSLPMDYPAGTKYQYSSGGMNLLSGILQKSTNQYLPSYLYHNILLPLDIKKFQMLTSPVGRGYLAGNFYLRPIDFTKFGMLILNEGVWKGKQIISKKWIDKITQKHIEIDYPKKAHYGYLWRILKRDIQDKEFKTIEAWGNGGQFLIIIPKLQMTITFTGGNYNLYPEMEKKPFDLLNKYILPSINLK